MGDRAPAFELIAGGGLSVASVAAGLPATELTAPEPVEALRGRARQLASMPRLQLVRALETSSRGLTEAEADERATVYGENILSLRQSTTRWRHSSAVAGNPFVVLLIALGVVAALTGNLAGALVVSVGAAISCGLRVQQERRGERAAAALRAMVAATASVLRRSGPGAQPVAREIPVAGLVPGDVVTLAPGDLVPADLYLLAATDLAISEWVLTGESRPALKSAAPIAGPAVGDTTGDTTSGMPWMCLMGGTVAHGAGTGLVIATGGATVFGTAHATAPERRSGGAFERSARRVTWMLLAFTALAVPAVFALASASRATPVPVLAFALAVAIGLTPEMLPAVITTLLARAARVLASDGTVVRRLPAVHDLAAMDTLCVDKTGTLTEGRLAVIGSVDAAAAPAESALWWAAAISDAVASHTPGLANAFDDALSAAAATAEDLAHNGEPSLHVLDVLPFDPARRRVSALMRDPARLGSVILATRGAVAEVLPLCESARTNHTPDSAMTTLAVPTTVPLTAADRTRLLAYADEQARQGARLLAVAVADLPPRRAHAPLRPADEQALTLVGFVLLRDRAEESAPAAIADLAELGVRITVLTGDAPEVAARVCGEIGLDPGHIATGAQIDACDAAALAVLAARTTVFAQVGPVHKARVVSALQSAGRVVGFLGDGVNDAPALRTADVGIAVLGGAELARECADVVLGGKDLAGLARAIIESRRAAVNAIKYLRITISSNLGNALSMALAVLVLPFLPMLPLQVLVQNLCFDLCQLALALDRVDPAETVRPRRLAARDPALFALVFGPLNTIADLATFVGLHHVLNHPGTVAVSPAAQAAFHAGWFAENLLTQALAIFLLRTRRPAGSAARPAWQLAAAGFLLAGIGVALPTTVLGRAVEFAVPPASFYPILILIVAGYCAAVIGVKAGCRKLRPGW